MKTQKWSVSEMVEFFNNNGYVCVSQNGKSYEKTVSKKIKNFKVYFNERLKTTTLISLD